MIKLLILAGVCYFGYRFLRSQIAGPPPSDSVTGNEAGAIDDIMVQDPHCRVYFPRNEGIEEWIDGESFYFCSRECRNRYMEKKDPETH